MHLCGAPGRTGQHLDEIGLYDQTMQFDLYVRAKISDSMVYIIILFQSDFFVFDRMF